MHQVEGVIDLVERHHMGDHRIDLDLALHVPVDDFGNIGAAARAAERRAFPNPSRYELERPRRYFRARGRNPDDDRLAQPRWQDSSACRITVTLPVQSNV